MKILFITVLSCLSNLNAFAHTGALNNSGCHNFHTNGEYHCHPGPKYKERNKFIGIPKIIDGDTIKLGRDRIRLHGIDAPESNQTCLFQGKEWRCGWEATNALSNIVGKHWVTCTKIDVDRYKRVIAVCRVGPINLNAWMVKNGWAVAYRKYSSDYVADEDFSRASGKGLWRGKFIMPWAWRRSK